MLQLIYGGAGCGKTFYARDLACTLAREGGNVIMLVPEQFSFETERAMLELLGAQDVRKVRIFSFTRLAEEVGRISHQSASARRLDDCGRVAVMGAALSSLKNELEFYGGKQLSSTFIEHLLDAVKEFKLCAISPQMLSDAASSASGTLRRKLSELALIYGAYEAIIAQSCLDPMDNLTRLWEQLGEHSFFEGATVIIDAFRGFTGQELRIISRIIAQAEKCVVTICAEEGGSSSDSGLFATSLKTAETIKSLAAAHGTAIAPSVLLAKRHRFRSEALEAIEAGIFRYSGTTAPYTEPTDDVTVYEADSRYSEMEFCARECRRLLREENYRCRDIAIIARSEEIYSELAFDALTMQNIPCFLDRRTDAASCALMQFVLAALDYACRGRQSSDILRWLKTGLVEGIDLTDIAEVENYCFVWNFGSKEWRNPFTQNPDGFAPEIGKDAAERLARINAVRERAFELLDEFCASLSNASGEEMAAALFRLLDRAGAASQLDRLCRRLEGVYADEQAQLWDSLMSMLDQITAIIGSRKISKDEFASYISLMINRCDIGRIPHGLDDVTFGGADRIRVTAPRAVFIVGAVEGEFPAAPAGSGVFTDDERKRLQQELQLPVAEPLEHQLLEERLMAYSTLSAASERLYITYPHGDNGDDGMLIASECITEVLKYVPCARMLHPADRLEVGLIESDDAAFELAARYSGTGTEAASLSEILSADSRFSARLDAVKAAADKTLPRLASREAAEKLFGGRMQLSSSRAETYHQCRFSFFCRYGLNINPRKKASLDHLQFGTVAHYVLENIFGSLGDASFSSLTDDVKSLEERIAAMLEDYLTNEMGGRDGKSAYFLYQLEQMKYSLTALVVNIAAELSAGDFRPVAFELEISPNSKDARPEPIELENGDSVSIVGKVDRVDCWQDNGHTYLRIIDYKTGTKEFKLCDVLEGLNMQMLIYLGELCREDSGTYGGSIPAGILYQPAFSGTIEGVRGMTDEQADDKRNASLKRNGLIIDGSDDAFVCNAMEQDLNGRFIPIKKTSKGVLHANSQKYVVTPTGYEIIGRYVRFRLAQMCGELKEGLIEPNPVKSSYDMCGSCDFYNACRYEGKLRQKFKGSNNETLQRMAQLMNSEVEENG